MRTPFAVRISVKLRKESAWASDSMAKRRWGAYPKRFKEEANSAGGLFGILGLGATAGGVVLSAPILGGIGGVAMLGAILWCGVRAVPPSLMSAEDLMGKEITNLRDLDLVEPRLRRIGFVGTSRVGKTTLISHLEVIPRGNTRTDSAYARVIRLPGKEATHFAFVDAAGQSYSQQFKVIDESERILIILDHSDSESSFTLDKKRVLEQRKFLDQIARHISNLRHSPRAIHFLLNKRDLWEGQADERKLIDWFDREVDGFRKLSSASITGSLHSNMYSSDISNVFDLLRRWASSK